jgi:hypothetical protein
MIWARLPRPLLAINQNHISVVGQAQTKIAGKKDATVSEGLI